MKKPSETLSQRIHHTGLYALLACVMAVIVLTLLGKSQTIIVTTWDVIGFMYLVYLATALYNKSVRSKK